MNQVRVNRKAADRVASGHPWIFSSDVIDRGNAEPGSVVKAVDTRNRLLGIAHYSSASQIALRMLSTGARAPSDVSRDFYLARIRAAAEFRE